MNDAPVDKPKGLLTTREFPAWRSRGLTEETCRKWQIGVSQLGDDGVRVFPYVSKDGTLVAQKVRPAQKSGMRFLGDAKDATLFGQHLWPAGGKMVVITEGEIDALSISQVQNHKWPVVSVPNGAQGARKALQKNLEWLNSFETVVLWFDDDDPGREAAQSCASLFKPGSCKLAKLPPYKDANEALVAGKSGAIVSAIWQAKVWRPDGIVGSDEVWEAITETKFVPSVPYPWAELQAKTDGLRRSEVVTLTAGSGVGKSAVVRSLVHHLLLEQETVGVMMFEETVRRAALGIMSIEMGKDIKSLANPAKEAGFEAAFKKTVGNGRCYLYDHFGSTALDNVLDRIRYMAVSLDCGWVFLDHLSILISGMADGDERRLIDNAMTAIKTLAMEVNVGIIIVSHLKRPEGQKGHEEGAATSLSQLRGSHAIAQLSDMVIGLERDQQDESRSDDTTIRILKNRWTGQTGKAGTLRYNHFTTRLQEITDASYEELKQAAPKGGRPRTQGDLDAIIF